MQKSRKRRRKKWIIGIILLLIAAGVAAPRFLWKKDEPLVVQTEKAARRDVTETVNASGRIQPVIQVVISPEVAGEIIDLPVKEGQRVKKGELLLQIKPDNYKAAKNSAEANYKFAQGNHSQAETELEKAEIDFKNNEELVKNKLVSPTVFNEFKMHRDVAKLRLANSIHQMDQARFALDRAVDDLTKTTIVSPIEGTVTKLKSQLGERVLGTSFNMGTEMMTVAQLDDMEARVDIGEIDIVLIEVGQTVQLEVDAFKEKKFKGTVSAIANASKGPAQNVFQSSSQQEAPKFEVKIRIDDKEPFRPGMSVTAEIETRSRKDVMTVPFQSVTTRLPPGGQSSGPAGEKGAAEKQPARKGKAAEQIKPVDVVFVLEGDHAKMIPVKTGISDNDYYEIVSGISDGQEVISGGFKAIRELEDGKKVKVGAAEVKTPPK